MILIADTITSRLQYITAFIGEQLTGEPIILTTDPQVFKLYNGTRINYSSTPVDCSAIHIQPVSLLAETGINKQDTTCFIFNERKAFFSVEGDLPFDIFAASFYLISRYEEYLPHTKDKYGRFAHENAIAYCEGFLQQPLVNYWIQELKVIIQAKFPDQVFTQLPFCYIPTYDIDEAYSYKHKGWYRNTGGLVRDVICFNWKKVSERIRVLTGRMHDPYDTFSLLTELADRYGLHPLYFFLVAAENAGVDKQILPHHHSMQLLIKNVSSSYKTGLHPSWQSGDSVSILQREKKTIEQIIGKPVTISRQHFIRFCLPEGYRRLVEAGIKEDYSMGYGSINGFRASVAASFLWYDLERDTTTSLRLFPFCYMEANSFYEQQLNASKALSEMNHYAEEVKKVNGLFISIWHNTFLGTDDQFIGWAEAYETFLKRVTGNDVK